MPSRMRFSAISASMRSRSPIRPSRSMRAVRVARLQIRTREIDDIGLEQQDRRIRRKAFQSLSPLCKLGKEAFAAGGQFGLLQHQLIGRPPSTPAAAFLQDRRHPAWRERREAGVAAASRPACAQSRRAPPGLAALLKRIVIGCGGGFQLAGQGDLSARRHRRSALFLEFLDFRLHRRKLVLAALRPEKASASAFRRSSPAPTPERPELAEKSSAPQFALALEDRFRHPARCCRSSSENISW